MQHDIGLSLNSGSRMCQEQTFPDFPLRRQNYGLVQEIDRQNLIHPHLRPWSCLGNLDLQLLQKVWRQNNRNGRIFQKYRWDQGTLRMWQIDNFSKITRITKKCKIISSSQTRCSESQRNVDLRNLCGLNNFQIWNEQE